MVAARCLCSITMDFIRSGVLAPVADQVSVKLDHCVSQVLTMANRRLGFEFLLFQS